MRYASSIKCELGWITAVEEDGYIMAILFDYQEGIPSFITDWAIREIKEYLNGNRTLFTFPYLAKGSEFEKKVWKAMLDIPYGETRSYKWLGDKIGCRGYQAIGNACGKNNLPILIPCHRVISAKDIGGYSAGLWRKIKLLEIEKPCFNLPLLGM